MKKFKGKLLPKVEEHPSFLTPKGPALRLKRAVRNLTVDGRGSSWYHYSSGELKGVWTLHYGGLYEK